MSYVTIDNCITHIFIHLKLFICFVQNENLTLESEKQSETDFTL